MLHARGILAVAGSVKALFRLLVFMLVLGGTVSTTVLATPEPASQSTPVKPATSKDFFKSLEGAIPITVLVTAIGWFVTSYLSRRRDDRTRKLENLLNH
jgi:hypothetical protein